TIAEKAEETRRAERVVLPGVGAIGPAMKRLKSLGLAEPIKTVIQKGKPFLGICLGLQLLFEGSEEGADIKTLSIFPGKVKKFTSLKIPHMGWNEIEFENSDCPFLKGIPSLTDFYFCHSYFVEPLQKNIIATTTHYGLEFTSSIWKDNVFAVQFHPEKSQDAGLTILKNFCDFKK
ncbi:MAG: imidazole glycerol phosphate synthase subunit HisH, partial [Candidatus Omnitrophica bacterium]|nr:imidazole glycerol phosphate synthase subunit HisH [Candidatus Omnitrophota bacterium]